jgi:hypothetical protein
MEIPNESIEAISTKTMEYWVLDDVLYANILNKAYIDVTDVQDNSEARKPLLDVDRPIPMIIDITKIDKLTKEGRTLSSTLTEGISAIAIIIGSGLSKVIGNYAIMINRPKVPTKLFTSITDARLWVRDYKPGA